MPLMILNALEGRALPIYGKGKNIRDWLFVEDHCAGFLHVLQAGVPGEKVNRSAQMRKLLIRFVVFLMIFSPVHRIRFLLNGSYSSMGISRHL